MLPSPRVPKIPSPEKQKMMKAAYRCVEMVYVDVLFVVSKIGFWVSNDDDGDDDVDDDEKKE
jgi:hypothetical protein